MPEIQTKDKFITLEELGVAINAKAGVTSVNSQTGAVSITPENIGAMSTARILAQSAVFSIPTPGNSITINMAGITASHILTHWNFSASPENAPPANLTWTTYAGYFTITNNGGTTAETIRPIFELPTYVN